MPASATCDEATVGGHRSHYPIPHGDSNRIPTLKHDTAAANPAYLAIGVVTSETLVHAAGEEILQAGAEVGRTVMTEFNSDLWRRMSPYLDVALELDPSAQEVWLADLDKEKPETARELQIGRAHV